MQIVNHHHCLKRIEGIKELLVSRRHTHLPRVTASPRNKDRTIVTSKVIGIVMAKKTGPLFSMTHTCI